MCYVYKMVQFHTQQRLPQLHPVKLRSTFHVQSLFRIILNAISQTLIEGLEVHTEDEAYYRSNGGLGARRPGRPHVYSQGSS